MPSDVYDKWAKPQNDSVNKNAEIVNKRLIVWKKLSKVFHGKI